MWNHVVDRHWLLWAPVCKCPCFLTMFSVSRFILLRSFDLMIFCLSASSSTITNVCSMTSAWMLKRRTWLQSTSACSGSLTAADPSFTSSLLSEVFGDFDHKHHGVFGLVAEGFPDDVDGVLVGDFVQGDSVHRQQLKPSLRTREVKWKRSEKPILHLLYQQGVLWWNNAVKLISLRFNLQRHLLLLDKGYIFGYNLKKTSHLF